MNIATLFFADASLPGTPEISTGWKTMSYAARGAFIVLGVAVLITIVAFIWAAFFRKKRKRRHSYERWHHQKKQAQESSEESSNHEKHHRRHRHRRHHRDRQLNPTLAETGGLPPIRDPQPENPPPAPPV